MNPFQDSLTDRARQLTREFLGHHKKVQAENPEFANSAEQVLSIISMELSRIASLCDSLEEKQMVVEGFSQALAHLRWNAEEAASMVKRLERDILER
ncbi:hypothetical protein SAMN02745127_00893 [Oceanospirillum multiglobuliferum]|uniref:Uncharacterized protein n=1 Tax=Oceanospirillum multiglobuliferum TaxID=64969 RepID=A0A1T4MRZ6_9GAMM|nr:hypothetical protein [Oceanospirillum multiglobuliferum]OPX56916.1 hypothetical protein BTE48_00315 [Oceanospirillum multiglobuliferum]SJZ69733.1 hypothetical protein SAMN02745127_00893 [Oceanospirillum multiglobuliferum]